MSWQQSAESIELPAFSECLNQPMAQKNTLSNCRNPLFCTLSRPTPNCICPSLRSTSTVTCYVFRIFFAEVDSTHKLLWDFLFILHFTAFWNSEFLNRPTTISRLPIFFQNKKMPRRYVIFTLFNGNLELISPVRMGQISLFLGRGNRTAQCNEHADILVMIKI